MSHENKEISGNDYQVFDKPPAHVDHEKSLRSTAKCGVVGVCPLCGEGWIHGFGRLYRRVYAGEQLHCCRCAMPVVCIPEDPTLRTPEMVENPWKKAERLEKELAGAKQEIEYLTDSRADIIKSNVELRRNLDEVAEKLLSMTHRCEQSEICYKATSKELQEWVNRHNEHVEKRDTLHDRFIALENQLAESRRNFVIIAKLLRGTE